MSHDHRRWKLECMLGDLQKFEFPNVHANGYDTRNYLDVDAEERDFLIDLLQAELAIDRRVSTRDSL